jgi:hypothetical protein
MNPDRLVQIAGAGAIALIVCSCETFPPGPFPRAMAAGWWDDEGVSGPPRIVVHIGEQKAYFYKGRTLVGESTISTGKPGFSTPPGRYKVLSKSIDHVSTLFGDYVDDYGNVVRSNIDSRKDRRPPGHAFRWRGNAVRDVLQGRLRDASGLCSTFCRVARLHPPASRDGETILRKRSCRHAGDRKRVTDG